MLNALGRDVLYALRVLKKDLGFTAVAVLTIALGVGANTTVFSVVEAILTFPFPVSRPDRVVFIYGENPSRNQRREGVSADDFLDWRAQARAFEHMVAISFRSYNARARGEAVRVPAAQVSEGYFALMDRPLTLGRAFLPEETEPGRDRVAVLSHAFWQKELGGSRDVAGQNLTLDGESYTIVGVAAENFFFPARNTALWTPLVLEAGRSERDDRSLFAVGRLREGTTPAEASVEMATIAARIAQAYPKTNEGWTSRAIAVRDDINSSAGFAMVVLYGSITAVLLIACANVANLLLSRSTVREKEIALRAALGAGRARVVRQLLTESLVLALAGGGLGLLIGIGGMRYLAAMVAPDPNIGFLAEDMELSVLVLAHTLAISTLSGLLFGVVPAIRGSKADLDAVLKEGARGGSGGARHHLLRNGLVVSQFALALALLSAAGTLLWAFDRIHTADPGFNPKGLLTFRIALPETTYGTPQQVASFERDALDALSRLPGVKSVGATTALPLTVRPAQRTARVVAEGVSENDQDRTANAIHSVVSPSFFETLEISLLSGRRLTDQDAEASQPVAVVTPALAKLYWRGVDPLGRRLKLVAPGMETPWLTVVGVVPDVRTVSHSLRYIGDEIPQVFVPYAQQPRGMFAVAVRTEGNPVDFAPLTRRTLAGIDVNLPLDDVATLEQVVGRIDTQNRFFVRILSGLALIALALAGVGVYGVVSYSVHRRTREIGIRMALGAEPGSVLRVVLKQGAVLAGIGFVLGLGFAIAIVRFLASELAGLGASNAAGPLTFAVVSIVLLCVAQVASFIPARRAVRVDPVTALRTE